jgi:WD40 repeat protein
MKKKRYEQFDIMEDPDALPARKPKRKRRPVHIPWRWVILTFLGAALVVGLVAMGVFLIATPVRVETDVVTVVPTLTGEGEFIRDIAWSGGRTAVAGTNSLRVYDDLVGRSQPLWMKDYGEAVNRVFNTIALSPDASQVAGIVTLSYPNGTVSSDIAVWDAHSGDLLREFTAHIGGNGTSSYGGDVKAITYSPDGSRMITGAGDGQLLVWDVATGAEVATLEVGGTGTWALAFYPDSSQVAAFIQYDQWASALQNWDVNTRQKVSEISLDGHNVWQVALSQDVAYMALREWREDTGFFLSLWDIQRGQQIGVIPLEEAFNADSFAVEGNWLAIAGRWAGHTELRTIRWQTGADGAFQYDVIGTKEDALNQADIRQLHFEKNGSRVTWLDYLSGGNSDLQRWNLDTGVIESIRFW